MRLTAALVAATILGFAAPASAADGGGRNHGWRQHGGHYGHPHHRQHRHSERRFYAEEAISVLEYREPYLPRGVLYNAPPLPVAYGYWRNRGDVISAKY
jgi:hypothetical protein